jgi:hypothetical protein
VADPGFTSQQHFQFGLHLILLNNFWLSTRMASSIEQKCQSVIHENDYPLSG